MITDCPYGASECPKITELKEIIVQNQLELKEVNRNVIRINTTLKNTAYIISLIVTVLSAIIGVHFL